MIDKDNEDPFAGLKKKNTYSGDVRNPKAMLKFTSIGDNFTIEVGKD